MAWCTRRFLPAIVLTSLFPFSVLPAAGQTTGVDVVVLTGDDALITPEAHFKSFGRPVLNGRGSIAFQASSTVGQGIYQGIAEGRLDLIAHGGQTTPGADGQFIGFLDPVQNAAGDLAFQATITRPQGASAESLWLKPEGAALELAAQAGTGAPGTADTFGSFPDTPLLDDDGEIAFYALLSRRPLSGVWKTSGGVPRLIALKGQAAPGTSEPFSSFSELVMNPDGDLAFFATLAGGGTGIWRLPRDGSLQLVVRNGDPAPGGGTFTSISGFGLVLNVRGDLAFAGSVSGESWPANQRIWKVINGGQVIEVLRGSDPVPGGSSVFGAQVRPFAFNADGSLGLIARLASSDGDRLRRREALYRHGASGITSRVLNAAELPSAGPNSPFNQLTDPGNRFLALGSNAAGDIAGITHGLSIFIIRAAGGLFTLVEGDSLVVRPGEVRRIEGALALGSGPGAAGPSGLADAGELAFKAFFDDSTQGIFIASSASRTAARPAVAAPPPVEPRGIRHATGERCDDAAEAAESDAMERFYQLGDMAKCALEAGEHERAENYARELLATAPRYPDNFSYGSAIHHGNIVLGTLALAAGNLAQAKGRLLKAGRTPGGPALDSFGPNMTLAKALLERGERDVVIAYFDLCARFWRSEDGRLTEWKTAAAAGRIPNFGANLRY